MTRRYREILATAFDADGDEWVFHANAWSSGVPVSSEERAMFLSFRLLAFRKAIKGRPATAPRRPYWPMFKRLLTAMVIGVTPKAKPLPECPRWVESGHSRLT